MGSAPAKVQPDAHLTEGRWRVAHDSPTLYVENLDGVWWYQKPVPPRFFHRHSAQTRAFKCDSCHWTYRCACGATRYSDIPGCTKRERYSAPGTGASKRPAGRGV